MIYANSDQEFRFMDYFNGLPDGKMLNMAQISKILKISEASANKYIHQLELDRKVRIIKISSKHLIYIKDSN